MIGNYIKDNRTKLNMTRSDLAEKLNVSVLKVSRWEDNEEEPEEEILKQLEAIFASEKEESNFDEAVEEEKPLEPTLEEPKAEEIIKMEEPVLSEPIKMEEPKVEEPKVEEPKEEPASDGKENQPKRVYNVCSKCGKRITDKSDLALITRTLIVDGAPKATIDYVCRACKEDYEARAKAVKVDPMDKKIKENTLVALRIHSIIWAIVNLVIFTCIGISMITNYNVGYGYGILFIAIGLVLGTFVGNVILQNNVVSSIYYFGLDNLKNTIREYPPVRKYRNHVEYNTNVFMRDIAFIAYLITLLAALFVNIFIGIVLYPISIAKNVKQAKL